MKATQALHELSVAAKAAADALVQVDESVDKVKPGLRLPNGERVLDYARTLYYHSVAAWLDDHILANLDILDLEVDEGEMSFYLVHWPGTEKCAIIYPSNAGMGNCAWRLQELTRDKTIEKFMRKHTAWRDEVPINDKLISEN